MRLLPHQNTINTIADYIDLPLKGSITAYIGCHLFTAINPAAAALFVGSALLISNVAKPIFDTLFIQDWGANESSRSLNKILQDGVAIAGAFYTVKSTGYAFTAKEAVSSSFLALGVILAYVAYEILRPWAQRQINQQTANAPAA